MWKKRESETTKFLLWQTQWMSVPLPEYNGLDMGSREVPFWPLSFAYRCQVGSRICKSLRGELWTIEIDLEGISREFYEIKRKFRGNEEDRTQGQVPRSPKVEGSWDAKPGCEAGRKKMFLESRARAVNYKLSNNSYQVQSYDKAPSILYRIRKHSQVSSTDSRSRMKIQL